MKKTIMLFLIVCLLVPANVFAACSTPREQHMNDQTRAILSNSQELSDKATQAALYGYNAGGKHINGALDHMNTLFNRCTGDLLQKLQDGWKSIESLSTLLSSSIITGLIKNAVEGALQKACNLAKVNTQKMIEESIGTSAINATSIINSARNSAMSRAQSSTPIITNLSQMLNTGNKASVNSLFSKSIMP